MREIPVILFAHARPAHLARTLACLRENRVPQILAFADGAKGPGDAAAVEQTRAMLRRVDWAEVRLVERERNFGLGRNVLAGVSAVAAEHDMFLVWEDDLICVPGTYEWMSAALRHYAEDGRVMSVTAWTHPRVTPGDTGEAPYFDARAECWLWGAWARSWRGMQAGTARDKMAAAEQGGMPADAYGADLPVMARAEARKNIWAVRWLYHHFAAGGLCLRPPWSMVEHIGFDAAATHAGGATDWANPPLRVAPPVPMYWPEPRENPGCRALWQAANPPRSWPVRLVERAKDLAVTEQSWHLRLWSAAKTVVPPTWRKAWRRRFGWRWFEGDFATWAEARAASGGYDDAAVLARVVAATRAVRSGAAAWERDGATFAEPAVHAPLLTVLRGIAAGRGGRLEVVDFGGALGSTWWQHRSALAGLTVRWCVVEQPHFVAAGWAELIGPELSFELTLADACARTPPAVILFSSVLQYLETPQAILAEVAAGGVRHVIIDRTPFWSGGRDWLAVQRTPPALGGGGYPAWVFDRAKLLGPLDAAFKCVQEWPGFDDPDARMTYRGLHLLRKETAE